MATKKLIGVGLLLFAALALLRVISDQGGFSSSGTGSVSVTAPNEPVRIASKGRQAVLFYFHTTFRCASCLTIEKTAREVVENLFKDVLAKGSLQFVSVDVEEPRNRHYIDRYQLVSKSLVLVEFQDGKEVRHKVLQGVWEQTSVEGLRDYIAKEIAAFMGDGNGRG